jgi:hypothetical protein
MLFTPTQPQGLGGIERLILRSCLRAASEIPDEDSFLAASIPDGPQVTLTLISQLVHHSVLQRVMEVIWYTSPKNYVRPHITPMPL